MKTGFIWYELLTDDPDAALRFYQPLLGWKARDSGQKDQDYRIVTGEGGDVGGVMRMSTEAMAGMKPIGWYAYVNVADVDRTVADFVANGGQVTMPPFDVPMAGRIAMVADPQGAQLCLISPAGSGGATAHAPDRLGHGAWHELHTTDWQAALGFYGQRFGWQQVEAMDMGPMGTYLMFGNGNDEGCGDPSATMIGGMWNNPQAARPYWMVYFEVGDIDRAVETVRAGGGQVLHGPEPVPGDTWIIQGLDPQGVMFALAGKRAA